MLFAAYALVVAVLFMIIFRYRHVDPDKTEINREMNKIEV